MSAQWQMITNNKLYFARLQLASWQRSEPHLVSAYRDPFLFHAFLAYRSMIAEMMVSCGCHVDELPDLPTALKTLVVKGLHCASIQQLHALEKDQSSWLAHLIAAYDAAVSGVAFSAAVSHNATSRDIAPHNAENIIAVSSDRGQVDDIVRGISSVLAAEKVLDELKGQVASFRQLNQEC